MYKTTVHVEGMMCGNCEAHVTNAVRKVVDAKSVKASKDECSVEIISAEVPDENAVLSAIREEGYTADAFKTEEFEKKGFFEGLFGKKA